jgi:hypothetical protein
MFQVVWELLIPRPEILVGEAAEQGRVVGPAASSIAQRVKGKLVVRDTFLPRSPLNRRRCSCHESTKTVNSASAVTRVEKSFETGF